MSQRIDPREVLTYLNELGYTNINAQQLKDFVTDLKKLIKYEHKHKEKENIDTVTATPINTTKTPSCHCPFVKTHTYQPPETTELKNGEKHCYVDRLYPLSQTDISREKEEHDVYNHLYNQHTVASRAKEIPRKDKHICVHIRKPKTKMIVHEHCTHIEKGVTDENPEQVDIQLVHNIETSSNGSKLYINTESTLRSIDPGSKQNLTIKPSQPKKKSKCSVIKCDSVKSIKKSDPVALYHYYQNQWKKQKFPGQEGHFDLRWSVREKLLGGPKIIPSTTSACRKRCNSWKG